MHISPCMVPILIMSNLSTLKQYLICMLSVYICVTHQTSQVRHFLNFWHVKSKRFAIPVLWHAVASELCFYGSTVYLEVLLGLLSPFPLYVMRVASFRQSSITPEPTEQRTAVSLLCAQATFITHTGACCSCVRTGRLVNKLLKMTFNNQMK